MIQTENFKEQSLYNFTLYNLSPLKLFKAMITLICDTNENCLGDDKLRHFLMNKESNEFDVDKYKLYAYLVTPDSMRVTGKAGVIMSNLSEPIILSEVSHYPIGFTLYIDKPEHFEAFGVNINSLVHHEYDEQKNLTFLGIPYVALNSKFPIDYRTKDEIITCINATEENLFNNKTT